MYSILSVLVFLREKSGASPISCTEEFQMTYDTLDADFFVVLVYPGVASLPRLTATEWPARSVPLLTMPVKDNPATPMEPATNLS